MTFRIIPEGKQKPSNHITWFEGFDKTCRTYEFQSLILLHSFGTKYEPNMIFGWSRGVVDHCHELTWLCSPGARLLIVKTEG